MSPSTELRENRELASELKFVVARSAGEQIRTWMRAHLDPDPHASGDQKDMYQITSLYFDTDQFDVFHRKGSFGRSKYRIRRYGIEDLAFLERKLKTRGLVTKRRSIVGVSEIERLALPQPDRAWKGCWYHQRLLVRRLRPVCAISYWRTARVAMSSAGPIRLTVDDEIRANPANGLVFNGSAHGRRLAEKETIVELKYRAEMPALFKQLVQEFALIPKPISKYRLAAVTLGLVPISASNPSAPGSLDSPVCLSS